MRRWMWLLLAPALLAGCGGPEVKSGTIVAKDYTAESGYYEPVCFAYDNKAQCTMQIYEWQDVPAKWSITLRNCSISHDGDKCPEESWDVTEAVYNSVSIGQDFQIK